MIFTYDDVCTIAFSVLIVLLHLRYVFVHVEHNLTNTAWKKMEILVH